jgi:hypothetical protein
MALPTAERKTTRAKRRRNPDWSRDETILLLDLYLRAPKASAGHSDVLALSRELNQMARRSNAITLPTFRNPAGIAMRLRNLSRHDPAASSAGTAGLRPGGAIDVQVWQEFAGDREALAAEVARICQAKEPEAERAIVSLSSHGPGPFIGTVSGERLDGETLVYILGLSGPLAHVLPDLALPPDFVIVKIGRSTDVGRRIAELSAGYPPGAALRLDPLWTIRCDTGAAAHSAERALLDHCDAQGWSLGGEFAMAPRVALVEAALRVTRPFVGSAQDQCVSP